MATPWVPSGHDSYPLVNIDKVPACQVQFKAGMSGQDDFEDGDCDIFGRKGYLIGMRMCVAKSKASPGSIIAGT